MTEAHTLGHTSLSVVFHTAGEVEEARRSGLGSSEWEDVADAIDYATAHGAESITLVGWSMGGAIALETARQVPGRIDNMVLVGPVTNWVETICYGAHQAGLPQWVGSFVAWMIASRAGARLLGLPAPINIPALSWHAPGDVTIPTTVMHTTADETVPFALSERFAAAHPALVRLVPFPAAPHGWEPAIDAALFRDTLHSAIARPRATTRGTPSWHR